MRLLRYFLLAAILCSPSTALAWLPPPFQLSWGGPGSVPGKFNEAYDVVVDGHGDVYVTDPNNLRVQKFDGQGHFINSFGVGIPTGIAVNTNGNILVANGNNSQVIEEHTTDGSFVNLWAYSDFVSPQGIAVDASGFIYVCDASQNKVYKFTNDGSFLMSWGGTGFANGRFYSATDVAVDDQGFVYVADRSRVQFFDANGTYRGHLGSAGQGPGQFTSPEGVTTDALGYVYVTDAGNDRVEVFRRGGYVAEWGTSGTNPGQFATPKGIGVAPDGSVFVADAATNLVQKFGQAPVPTQAVTLGHIKAMYRGEKTTTP